LTRTLTAFEVGEFLHRCMMDANRTLNYGGSKMLERKKMKKKREKDNMDFYLICGVIWLLRTSDLMIALSQLNCVLIL
ncbi:hypothetical protein ACJX0J_018430, partial [Zea mays]